MIFISYRRDDSNSFSGRLYDSLAKKFGPDKVFFDHESIEIGSVFPEVLKNKVVESSVVLVVIGQRYLTILDEFGKPRINNEEDFVNIEISLALTSKKSVVPILIDDTSMPSSGQLPLNLVELSKCNAFSIDQSKWSREIDFLSKKIIEMIKGKRLISKKFDFNRPIEIPIQNLDKNVLFPFEERLTNSSDNNFNYGYGMVVEKIKGDKFSTCIIRDNFGHEYSCNYSDVLTEGHKSLEINNKVRFVKKITDNQRKATYIVKYEEDINIINIEE